tara:strand:+ start:588 stop:734 length:147 start_codon:yes stop_codon:yes gene_type:complete
MSTKEIAKTIKNEAGDDLILAGPCPMHRKAGASTLVAHSVRVWDMQWL